MIRLLSLYISPYFFHQFRMVLHPPFHQGQGDGGVVTGLGQTVDASIAESVLGLLEARCARYDLVGGCFDAFLSRKNHRKT